MNKYFSSLVIFLVACQDDTKPLEETPTNNAPIVSSVGISADGPVTTSAELQCDVDVSDPDGDNVEVSYAWVNRSNGENIGESKYLKLNPELVRPEDELNCEVEATDSNGGMVTAQASVSVENTAPQVNGVAINSEGNFDNQSELLCDVDASDADNDQLSYRYKWENNGEEIGKGQALNVTMVDLQPGDQVDCKVEVEDEFGSIEQGSANIVIANNAPSLAGLVIESDDGMTNRSLLRCTAEAMDVDGDTVDISYRWANAAGDELGTSSSLQLNPSIASVGEVIECEVTIVDPSGDSVSGAVSITIENTEPTWSKEASVTPATNVVMGVELLCEAQAEDEDGDTVKLKYEWKNNGQLIQSGPSMTVESHLAQPGDTVECVATAQDDNGAQITDVASISVDNTKPVFTSDAEIIASGNPTTDGIVTCNALAEDSDGGKISLTYNWKNITQGTIIGQDASLQLSNALVSPNDEIECVVLAEDEHQGTAISTTASLRIENTAPHFTLAATIDTSTEINVDSTVNCEAKASDIDGDTPVLEYKWSNKNSGVELGTQAELVLDSSLVAPMDDIRCEVTATDAQGRQVSSVSYASIENRAPTFTAVAEIQSNGDVYNDSSIDCNASADDVDGEQVTLSYEWSNDNQGVVISSEATLHLDSSMASPDDSITCTVTAQDPSGASETSAASVSIENRAPVFGNNEIFSSTNGYFAHSTLTCVPQITEADGESTQVSYEWQNLTTSTVIGADATLDLAANGVETGDEVACVVTVTDSNGLAASDTITVSVGNLPPVGLSVGVSPQNPEVEEDILCEVISPAINEDGHTISYQFAWFQNGAAYSGTTMDSTYPGDTIPGSVADKHDNFTCEITATDGYDTISGSDSVTFFEADPLDALTDNFDNSGALTPWNMLNDVEGWAADQIEYMNVNDIEPGKMILLPYASSWVDDYRAPFMYKEVSGNFMVTTLVQVNDRTGATLPNVEDSMAGLLIRSGRNVTPSTWATGGENHISLTVGAADQVATSDIAAQNTEDSVSSMSLNAGWKTAELRLARIDDYFILMARPSAGAWTVQARYERADLPETLQVGLTAYSDSSSVLAMDPLTFNGSVLTSGNADLMATFDFIKYQTLEMVSGYESMDLLDETTVNDAVLLNLLEASLH